jgi:hypothetical protein
MSRRARAAAALLATAALAACGGSPQESTASKVETTASALSTLDATALVQAACKRSFATRNACEACVDAQAGAFVKQKAITRRQAENIEDAFAHGACRARCIPTTCAIEGASCGSIPDLCGGTLDCGTACGTGAALNLQRCFCNDTTQLDLCGSFDCSSGLAQDAICGPVCATHGGELGTGCLVADPVCAAP